jgi:hypothetical protein
VARRLIQQLGFENVITDSGEYDLLWDETSDGNRWINNRCDTSNPVGLCEP